MLSFLVGGGMPDPAVRRPWDDEDAVSTTLGRSALLASFKSWDISLVKVLR